MMDHFKEEIVSPRNSFVRNMLYILAWIFMVIFGIYALMMLQFVFVAFSLSTLVGLVSSAAFAILLFIYKDRLKLEYEYSFTNGTLDFAQVMRNASRKELGSMNVQNVTACGHVAHDSFQRYLAMKDVEKKNWFLNRDGNLFYFYYVKNDKKHMIIIEPTEELVEMICRYLPVGVYQG